MPRITISATEFANDVYNRLQATLPEDIWDLVQELRPWLSVPDPGNFDGIAPGVNVRALRAMVALLLINRSSSLTHLYNILSEEEVRLLGRSGLMDKEALSCIVLGEEDDLTSIQKQDLVAFRVIARTFCSRIMFHQRLELPKSNSVTLKPRKRIEPTLTPEELSERVFHELSKDPLLEDKQALQALRLSLPISRLEPSLFADLLEGMPVNMIWVRVVFLLDPYNSYGRLRSEQLSRLHSELLAMLLALIPMERMTLREFTEISHHVRRERSLLRDGKITRAFEKVTQAYVRLFMRMYEWDERAELRDGEWVFVLKR